MRLGKVADTILYGLNEAGARAAKALPKLHELAAGGSMRTRIAAEAIVKIEAALAAPDAAPARAITRTDDG